MNKKEIAGIRKEFKPDSIRLKVGQIFNSYCKVDGKKIIFSEKTYFSSLDEETQEMFLDNFKKMLTGNLNSKLFELDFQEGSEGISQQKVFYNLLNDASNFDKKAEELTQQILEETNYDTDILVSIMKAEYYAPTKKKRNNEDDGDDDTVVSFNFMLCSINRIEQSKKALKFDYNDKELKVQSSLDLIINLNKPIDGIMFPVLTDGYSNVNKVVYFTSKANQINESIVTDVLKCKTTMTAKDEKDMFGAVLKSVVGDKVKPEVLHNVYENIKKAKEENEGNTVSSAELEKIFENEGIDASKVKGVIEEIVGEEKYDFNVDSVVPSGSKSVKINNSDISISISPAVLKNVKQVNKGGKKCLVIELDESVILDGFEVETEK